MLFLPSLGGENGKSAVFARHKFVHRQEEDAPPSNNSRGKNLDTHMMEGSTYIRSAYYCNLPPSPVQDAANIIAADGRFALTQKIDSRGFVRRPPTPPSLSPN